MMTVDSKLLVFRFDVDSHRCIREGVPNLLDLGKEVNAHFSFFVNMGRAVDRVVTLKAILQRTRPVKKTCLSPAKKLGRGGYLVAALLNPKVGAGSPEVIRRALREGHEVGLHGGRNHASWQAGASTWDERRFEREVATGKRLLLRAAGSLGKEVRGFASPGWQGPPGLWPVLAAQGFQYVADIRGWNHRDLESTPDPSNLCCVPTHFVKEPGGVAYLEYHEVIGTRPAEIMTDFESALAKNRRFLVLYDHPYYAGIGSRLDLLREMIKAARQAGYRMGTMSELVAAHGAVGQA